MTAMGAEQGELMFVPLTYFLGIVFAIAVLDHQQRVH